MVKFWGHTKKEYPQLYENSRLLLFKKKKKEKKKKGKKEGKEGDDFDFDYRVEDFLSDVPLRVVLGGL